MFQRSKIIYIMERIYESNYFDTGSLARIDRIRTRFRPKWGHFRVRIWPKRGLIRPRKLRKDWFAHLSCSMILIAPFTGFIPCSYCGYMFVCPILLKHKTTHECLLSSPSSIISSVIIRVPL